MPPTRADAIARALDHLVQAATILRELQQADLEEAHRAATAAASPPRVPAGDPTPASEPTEPESAYLTLPDALKRVPFGINRLRDLVNAGEIPHVKLPGRGRILLRASAVEAWLASLESNESPDATEEEPS